jgi:rRNA biogenesis protein RRP5
LFIPPNRSQVARARLKKCIDGLNGEGEDENKDIEMKDAPTGDGISAGGFDWSTSILDKRSRYETESEPDSDQEKCKKKHRKSEIKHDLTGDFVSREPQSASDFERVLLGNPNDSKTWIQYMSFQLQLSEVEKAREIAERALKTIALREGGEKLNMWIAMLNMENIYGSNDSLEEVFKRACQYNDAQAVHERLVSIYIQTGKTEVRFEFFSIFFIRTLTIIL